MGSTAATTNLDLLSFGGNFLIVLALLLAVLWALRRVQGIKGLQGFKPVARRLSVVETLSVGPRQKIAIVKWDGREVLVGVTPTSLNRLDALVAEPLQADAVKPFSAEAA